MFMHTITKPALLLTFFSATTLSCFAQKQLTKSLNAVVKAIANSDVYEVSYTVGFAGSVSQQYLRFNQLLSMATEQQLTDLAAQNKNAVVRLYALQALRQKNAKVPDSLLEKFQQDRTIVLTLSGCNGDKKMVSELAGQKLEFASDLTNK